MSTKEDWLARVGAELSKLLDGQLKEMELAQGALLLLLAVVLIRLSTWTFGARTRGRALLGLTAAATTCAAVVVLGLGWLGVGRPSLALLTAGLPLAAVLVRLGSALPGWWSGFGLLVTGQVQLGDDLRLPSGEGRLAGFGLLRARVERAGGEVDLVPWSQLSGVVTRREGTTFREVRFALDLDEPLAPTARQALEARVAMCPYRVWQRPYRVRADPDRRTRIWIELSTWSESSARQTEAFLERVVRLDLASVED